MSWWTNIFGGKDEWRMCKQLDTTFISSDAYTRVETKHNINYYLYENQFGERKFDIADSKRGDCEVKRLEKDDITFRLRLYRETVKPWLDGRTDPEIPSYESIPRKDFQRILTKKK